MLFDVGKIPRSAKLTRTLVPRSQVPQLNSSNNNSGNLNDKNQIRFALLPELKGAGVMVGNWTYLLGLVATEGLTNF